MAAPTNHATGTLAATVQVTEPATSIVSTIAVAGVFQFAVSLANMLAGDVVQLEVRQRLVAAGAVSGAWFQEYTGVQSGEDRVKISVPITNTIAEAGTVELIIHQLYGTSRSFAWVVWKFA